MELRVLPQRPPHCSHLASPFMSPNSIRDPPKKARSTAAVRCRCSNESDSNPAPLRASSADGRRWFVSLLAASATGLSMNNRADAVSTSRRALRSAKIPESEFTTLPNGLKYYDIKVGGGPKAVKGSRVAVHYVAKWKGITFMTSRQGLGVGGGTGLFGLCETSKEHLSELNCFKGGSNNFYIEVPHKSFLPEQEFQASRQEPYGFDVGQSERGNVLKGLDLGVEGMKVGGQRLLIIPPELAYGSKGVQEIPPNATIELDVELLSIKQSPFGTAVKLVEG